jgi:hypothetical protein
MLFPFNTLHQPGKLDAESVRSSSFFQRFGGAEFSEDLSMNATFFVRAVMQ